MIHLNEAHKNFPCNNLKETTIGTESNYVCVQENRIEFVIQDGPIKEAGINGVQVTDMLLFCKEIYKSLNKAYPCRENALTITKIEEAIHWQDARTKDRESRGVEGKNKL